MKVALLVAIVALAGIADATPTHEHPLEDAAHVVPDSDEPDLEAQLRALQTDAGVALGVVVIRTTGNETIESYARARREEWSRGTAPAALFVLAVDDRRSRLEVNDALRDKFPDSRAQAILDNLKGYLRSSDYSAAIRAMIREVHNGASGVVPDLESPHPQSPDVAPTYTPHYPETPSTTDEEPQSNVAVLLAVLFGAALFVLIAFMWARSRIASRATVSSHGVHVDASVLAETFVCMGLIIGGIFYVALMVLAASAGDSDSSSSSDWGSSDSSGSSGSSGSSDSSSSGGWSGGGASSSW